MGYIASQTTSPPAKLGHMPLLPVIPGPLGQLRLWNFLCPMALWVPLNEPPGDTPGCWSSPGITLARKSLPENPVGGGALGKCNLGASVQNHILITTTQTARRRQKLSGRGKRKKGAIVALHSVRRGPRSLASSFLCPGKHLEAIFKQPKVYANLDCI